MEKKTIYWVIAIIVVLVIIAIVVPSKTETVPGDEAEDVVSEEVVVPEEETEGLTEEEKEDIVFFEREVPLVVSSTAITPNKFRVKKGELLNISLTNTEAEQHFVVTFEDPFFEGFKIIVPSGVDEIRTSSVSAPMEAGEYVFYSDTVEPKIEGTMIVE